MAIKAICYIVISIVAVFICTCSAVTVTIGNLGDVVEGTETRMTCNIVRDSGTSTLDPIYIWNNITNGITDKIGTFQSGFASLEPSYIGRFSVEDDASLIIANTLRSDSGTYQCSVIIIDDNPTSGDDDVTLNVIYLEAPILSFDTPVTEGDTVEISCSVNAKPAPLYTFRRDGTVVHQSGLSTLRFQPVDRSDEGIYECETINSAGTATTDSKMLEVYYVPEITPLGNTEVSPGETVEINFNVDANPPAAYEWTTTPETTDTDNNPATYSFIVSESIEYMYTVTLNASNVVGATQQSVEVKVVARTTTLIYTTTNAFTTLPPSASCGTLSIEVEEPDVKKSNDEISVVVGDDVVLSCQCGDSTTGNGFKYRWTLDGDDRETNEPLAFPAKAGDHDVVCISTAGAPTQSSVDLKVRVTNKDASTDVGIGTGAIVGIVVGIIVMLVILAIVIIIVLKSRDDGSSNKSADSAYMDVTWDTKDPNRVNQSKKTAPPSNGTKQQEAAKPDSYDKYDRYGDERAYSRTSYGDDYNDKTGEDDYANSMPVTV